MAQEDIRLSGTFLNSSGNALANKEVTLYRTGTVTPAIGAGDTTDSNGEWDLTATTPGRYDVQLVSGTETIRILARDKFQVTEIQARNPTTAQPALSAYSTTSEAASLVATFGFRPSTESSGVETADTPSDGDLGYIDFTLSNDHSSKQEWIAARIAWEGADVSDGSEDGQFNFWTMTNGTLVEELHLSGAALWPEADAGLDLGTSALGFNDLHLGSGGVVNFDGGDVTLTHASNALTLAGGTFTVSGNTVLNGDVTLGDAAGDVITINGTVAGANAVIFEGDAGDGNEVTLSFVDPDADRTIYMPDQSGYLGVFAADTSSAQISTTVAELNLIDGDTARGTTAIADGDGVLINDGGTMRMTTVETLATYMEGEINAFSLALTLSNTLTVGSDGSGTDVIFYSGTSGDNLTWDASEEVLQITGTDGATSLDVLDGDVRIVDKLYFYDRGGEYLSSDGSTLTITGATTVSGGLTSTAASNTFGATSFNDADITNVGGIALDTITSDGSSIAFGSAGSGEDVYFYSATSGDHMLWDSSDEKLVIIGTDGQNALEVTDGNVAITDNLTVSGNLTVNGTTTTVDTTNTTVKDSLIELNNGVASGSNSNDSGLLIERGSTGNNAIFMWDESADVFTVGTTTSTADSTGNLANFTAAPFTAAAIVGTTIDASTDFTIGDTVITDGVVTDSTGLQLAANLDINGTVDISGDLTLSAGADGALQFTNAGENSIKIPDNQASALIIEEANNAYITFVTTDSSESVTFGKAVDLGSNTLTSTGSMQIRTIDYSDGDLAMTIADGGGVTFAQDATFSGDVALADDKVINLGEAGKIDFGDEAPADNAATGIVFSFIAGATLAVGDVVYMHTDGEVAKADADAVTSMPAIGICVGAGTDGNAVDVLVQGIMHDTSAFDTFTVGADIFVSTTAGAVTATAPSGSGDTVQKVGVALHADMVYFNFNTTEVLLA